jgi:succinoglycan biosynthesis transport protein ExoP
VNAPATNASDDPSARPPAKAIMPMLSLRRHWRKSALVFSVIAGLGLPLAYIKGTAEYRAEAVIQVNFRYASNLSTMQEIETHSDSQYRRLVKQQMRTITRYDVIERALDSLLPEERALWQLPAETDRKAIQRLTWSLELNAVSETYLVTIGLRSEDPRVIPIVVNAVVDSYLVAAREEIFFGSETRLENLEARKRVIEAELDTLGEKLQVAAAKLGLSTFEEGVKSPSDKELAEMEERRLQAQQARIIAEAKVQAMRAKHARLLELSLDAEAQKMTSADRALGDLRAYLYQRRAKLVQTMSGLMPSHAGRQAAEQEIAQINAEIDQATAEKQEEMKEILRERRAADMRTEAADLEAALLEAKVVEEALTKIVEARKEEVKDFRRVFDEGVEYREEMERLRLQLAQIRNRIDTILAEEGAPGYVRSVSEAEQPLEPISGGRKKIFIIFLVLATGAASVLPLALDFLDSRIQTPIDLHRILGFKPTAWLPEVTHKKDRVLFEKQLERLGVALVRDLKAQGPGRSIFVAETLPGAGKTLVAHLLGDELTKLGLSTLVVSCDPENKSRIRECQAWHIPGEKPAKPDQDQHGEQDFDVDPDEDDVGLIDLLTERLSIDEVIKSCGDMRADLIGFGSYEEASEAGNVVRLQAVIQELEQRYEVVLVDGPAMLQSATAEAIAGFCYGTLLVVKALDTPVKPLKRALAMLESADPDLIAAVLNRAPIFKGGGYFSHLADALAKRRSKEGWESS